MNTALAITERWVERVERDALSWTEQGLNSSSLTGTYYLSALAGNDLGDGLVQAYAAVRRSIRFRLLRE